MSHCKAELQTGELTSLGSMTSSAINVTSIAASAKVSSGLTVERHHLSKVRVPSLVLH